MLATPFTWPKNILKGLSTHNLTIFFGAGVTKELGYPLWGEFIDELENEVTISEESKSMLPSFKKQNKYAEIIGLYMQDNREETYNLLQTTFNKDCNISDTANEVLLLKLNASHFITTNVDNSLEYAKSKVGKKLAQIYTYDQDTEIRDKIISKEYAKDPLMIRIHGSLDRPQNMVFSKEQYSKINYSDYFVFSRLLPALFTTTTVLFVGYSLNDSDILNIIKETADETTIQRNLFLLNHGSGSNDSELEKLGVQILNIDDGTDPTTSLKNKLNELVKLNTIFENTAYRDIQLILAKGEKTRNEELQQLLNSNN